MAKEQPPKRIWEVDFVRGLMILFVVWDHFMYDVSAFEPYQSGLFNWLYALSARYYSGVLRQVAQPVFRHHVRVYKRRVLQFLPQQRQARIAHDGVCAVVYGGDEGCRGDSSRRRHYIFQRHSRHCAVRRAVHGGGMGVEKVRQGVAEKPFRHCDDGGDACRHNSGRMRQCQTRGLTTTHCGFSLQCTTVRRYPAFTDFYGGDYLPFFPAFGWFLVGAFLGKFLYRQRQSLFPTVNEKWVCPVTFCGRHAIWIYFGSQLFMYGLFYLFCVLI